MTKKSRSSPEENRGNQSIKMFGMLLPAMPSLIIRLGGTFLRFKRQAKKAGKVFRKELVKQGIDKQTAQELTEIYMEGSHLSKYMMQNIR